MIVYVYNKHTNEKLDVINNVRNIVSLRYSFKLHVNGEIITIEKNDKKLVVYGF